MKTYGACIISAIPMRLEPSHKSEMISQLLFGDLYSIEKHQSQWLKIICLSDMYEGWIDIAQSYSISKLEMERLADAQCFHSAQLYNKITKEDNQTFLISLGSKLFGENQFSIGDQTFKFSGLLYDNKQHKDITTSILDIAKACLNIPYLWGGKTTMGFDCSGLTQVIYRMHNIQLPRDASQQFECGKKVNHISEGKAGDLAFFGDTEKITHVGILTENNEIIHCSGKVRLDMIDENGIYQKGNVYTHTLCAIRRFIG